MKARKLGLIIVVVLGLLLSLAPTGGTAVGNELSALLVPIAKSYLVAQHEMLITGDKAVLDKVAVSLRGDTVKLLDEVTAVQLRRHQVLKEFGGGYTSFELKLSALSVSREGNQATLLAEEHSTLRFETKTSAEPVYTQSRTKHEFLFLNEGGKWFLAEDIRLDEPKPVKPEAESWPVKAMPLRVPLYPEKGEQAEEQRRRPGLKLSPPSLKGWAYWDRYAAKDYARRYALNYNPGYRAFGSDCTNFISQAAYAGGWPTRWGYYLSVWSWWYNYYNQTRTWVNGNWFWWFTYNTGRAYWPNSAGSWYSVWIGDVIQIDFDHDGWLDHSMIVTRDDGAWGGGDFYVSYHTNDVLDRPFWDLWAQYPNAWYYLWWMESFYD